MPCEHVVRLTVGIDDCKNVDCGARLAFTPTIGEEAECPECGTVHIIVDGGLLKRKEPKRKEESA